MNKKKVYEIIDQNRMEISAWNPMNRRDSTTEKMSSGRGLMTSVVTWRASSLPEERKTKTTAFFFFNFTVFAVRCTSVEFPHTPESVVFWILLNAPKM